MGQGQGDMALPTWPVPVRRQVLVGVQCVCPGCVEPFSGTVEHEVGLLCSVGFLFCVASPAPSPVLGWEGASVLCLADICRTVQSILVPRQPVSDTDSKINPSVALVLGPANSGVWNSGTATSLASLRPGSSSPSSK